MTMTVLVDVVLVLPVAQRCGGESGEPREERSQHIDGDIPHNILTNNLNFAFSFGVILDGAIRDRPEIVKQRFPVFHVGTSPAGPDKNGPGSVERPVTLRGTRVDPGDIVCADADGVAVVPAADWDRVKEAITALEEREAGIMARIAAGEKTVDIYGLKELS